MTDEQKLHQREQRGRRAKDIIEDPLVVEAFEQCRDKIIREWEDCPTKDEDFQKRCKQRLESMKIFQIWFEDVVVKGESAKAELADLERKTGVKRMFK